LLSYTKRHLLVKIGVGVLISISFLGFVSFAFSLNDQELSLEPEGFQFDYNRWPYPLYNEIASRLRELSSKYPKLTRLHNIGKTVEGRDLLVLEITNQDTGPAETKPAMWLDANMHADEVNGRPVLMYFIERLLAGYGNCQRTTSIINTRTFYVLPVWDADGGEKVLTAHPAWPGHRPEQHNGKDLDGDGYITTMRIRDPAGPWYPSPKDDRIMLRIRERDGERWNYIPTAFDQYFDGQASGILGIKESDSRPAFDDTLAPRDRRYRLYVEGQSLEEEVRVDREPTNFNRNWSAEWRPEERGAGPFPFSQPEVYAVAKFITSHNNIFFHYNIHADHNQAKNYIVRPPMDHPYDWMPPEDNEFYVRLGAVWAAISGGCLMESDYASQEVKVGYYGKSNHGFVTDWAYMQHGIHCLTPEFTAVGKDYDGDGYVTIYETLRWNDEEMGGRFFAAWKPYKHPELGPIEIGGERGLPVAIGERLQHECRIHFALLLYIAELSPSLRIADIKVDQVSSGVYRVVATVQNTGWLSTYVTRNALRIRRDSPILAKIRLEGGEVVSGKPVLNIGHILGRLAYAWRWGQGVDESTRNVEWTVKSASRGPLKVTVEVESHQAGRDTKTMDIP
jgi:hypothetical protein